ncbi:hypothetical protein GGI05_001292 [Coemansia sp. RSA 2603]|nr:hypothetical protein GGI05_001292 [Coemansia sp. RSA 2603]
MRYKFLEPPTTYNVKYTTHVCPEHTREKLENGPKRRRASDVGTSLLVKRATRRQSALPFSSLRGASRSLLDSQSPSPSMPDDHQSQSKRRAVQPSESMDDEAVDSGTSPMQDGSYTPSSGGLDGSRRKNIRKKRRFRHGSSNPERQEYYDRTIVKVHNELGRLKNGQIPDDDQNDYGSSINFGSHASDQEDEIIGSGSVAAVRNGAKADTRSLSSTTSAVAAVNAGTGASSGNKREKRKLTLRLGGIDAERNSGNSSDETIDEPIVSGSRGKNADHGRTNTDSAHQNTLRSSPVSTQSPHQPPRNLPAAPQDQASASQNHQSHSEKSNPPALQQNKRSVLRVRAFKEVSKTPPSGPGAGGFPLSAGPRANPPLSALEHSQRIAAASVSMPEEQVKMIKETHEMMKAQNDMLKSVHSMIKDLAVNPSRHAQQALSTISNLSALVSNGVNGDSADASDSVVVANPGPSSAKDNNGANTGIGISGTNGVLALPSGTALPKPAPELISNGSAAPSAPKPFSIATELQLPKSAAASPKLPPINAFASGKPQLGPSMLRGVAQTPSQSPARTPVASRPLSADPGLEDGELEEMKDNIIYLIKAVNIPQILSDMISNTADPTMSSNSGGSRPVSPTSSASDSKPLPPQLKAMVANLRPIGALSKDNVHEYLKVLVNSMKDVRSKHV